MTRAGVTTLILIAVLIADAVRRIRREARPAWPCALNGHQDLLVYKPDGRVVVRCSVCLQESAGAFLGVPVSKDIFSATPDPAKVRGERQGSC